MNKFQKYLQDNPRKPFTPPDPRLFFNERVEKCSNVFERQKVFKDYYEYNHDLIISRALTGHWFDVYGIDFTKYFTPIEYDAWCVIRAKKVILYPQYPVLNYFLDFGNPYLKIGLETDGKAFHDPVKDKIRDNNLWKEGWKIFRVTGSEANRIIEIPDPSYGQEEYEEAKSLELNTTVEGVIEALYQVYFREHRDESDYYYYSQCIACLKNHSLVDFEIS